MWLSAGRAPQPNWIQYEFDKVYKLHQMPVWNYNMALELSFGLGVKDATVQYSLDGADWSTLGTTHEFAQAPGAVGYAADTTIDFAGAAAKYVKITASSNWSGIVTQYGLSEVRFLYVPLRAREPDPDSGAAGVDVDSVTLSWRTGREAASHQVYFSASRQAVIDETISPVSVPASSSYASYDTGELDLEQDYYWKVNEVNTAETPTTWQGDLWTFATREYFVVDDMESYGEADAPGELGSRIWYTWNDGYGWTNPDPGNHGNGTGAIVDTNDAIVNGGSQSLRYDYDNDGTFFNIFGEASSPSYSEAKRTFDTPQDWTKYAIKSFTLWFFGDPNNDTTEQMYVKLNGSKVAYDGNVNNLTRTGWHEWRIDLKDFIGVDFSSVTEISIGFERSGPTGGSGVVYFDDISLYPARCVPQIAQPGADLNDDCVVDYLDLQIMVNQWLSSGVLVTPQLAGRTEPFSEPFDLNVDGTVDFKDFTALADGWLDQHLWP